MRANINKHISRPEMVKEKLPLTQNLHERVEQDRKELFDIIEGKDKRKIVIVGPCSAWPKEAVIEYAKQIKQLQEEVKDTLKIVMRVYTQKPRTTLGWTGPINQPNPFENPDIEAGIQYCRETMLEIISLDLPIADEALFTHGNGYFDDLLSWVAIGARSSEDQEHRIYASMLDEAVGMKNPTSGDIKKAINSVVAAQNSHTFLLNNTQVTTQGNQHAHLILRGGNGEPNISNKELQKASQILQESVENPSILIDCSHENSVNEEGKKDPLKQGDVLKQTIEDMQNEDILKSTIKGFMIESFLKTGKQSIDNAKSKNDLDLEGLSITDGCLGIEETKELIKEISKKL